VQARLRALHVGGGDRLALGPFDDREHGPDQPGIELSAGLAVSSLSVPANLDPSTTPAGQPMRITLTPNVKEFQDYDLYNDPMMRG
jgi:hypothetical protein